MGLGERNEHRRRASQDLDETCSPPVQIRYLRVSIINRSTDGTGDPGVLKTRLPDELEQVIGAGQNVIDEDDGIESLAGMISHLPQRREGGIADLGKVFDPTLLLSRRD